MDITVVTTSTPPGQFGKAAPRFDQRTIKLGSILSPLRVQAPSQLGWTQQVAGWGMLGNDATGDCVEAAMLHQDELWTRTARPAAPSSFTDADALGLYSAISGYDQGAGGIGPGTVYLDALRYWRTTGLPGDRKLSAYGVLDWTNQLEMQASIFALGGVQLGFCFPDDFDWSLGYWIATKSPGNPEKGHGVVLVAYDQDWYWCLSWGRLYALSATFVRQYGDEAYGCVSEDWQHDPTTPAGVDLTEAADDLLRAVAQATA